MGPAPLKIAVVGAGISGMSAAWLLSQRHQVTVYEAENRLGGHSHTVDADPGGGQLPVDMGFIVYNEPNYPNLVALFEHLGVPTEWSDMSFGVSVDGFGAGPAQSLQDPLGVGGTGLHQWFFPTRTFQKMLLGKDEGTTGVDDQFAVRGFDNIGAWILGRNMFGPVRGPWPDDAWKGWWGASPPYHVPVFVLTHHPRASIEMEGGTTFHFVTDGIHAALERARAAAGGQDVRIGGGPSTIREFFKAGLIDHAHITVVPILLGRGVRLWDGLEGIEQDYTTEAVSSPSGVTHVQFTRKSL